MCTHYINCAVVLDQLCTTPTHPLSVHVYTTAHLQAKDDVYIALFLIALFASERDPFLHCFPTEHIFSELKVAPGNSVIQREVALGRRTTRDGGGGR